MVRALPILVGAAYVFMIFFNVLQSFPNSIMHKTNKQISDENPTFITPSGFTFAIWGLIYTFVTIYVVYQFFSQEATEEEELTADRLRVLQIFNFVTNGLWLYAFCNEQFWLSVLLIVLNLIVLATAYRMVGVCQDDNISWKQRICVSFALSSNVAWVFVATLACLTITLRANRYLAPPDWATAWLIVVALVANYIALNRADVMYVAVTIWACIGIAVGQKNYSSSVYHTAVGIIVELALALLVGVLFASWGLTPAGRHPLLHFPRRGSLVGQDSMHARLIVSK